MMGMGDDWLDRFQGVQPTVDECEKCCPSCGADMSPYEDEFTFCPFCGGPLDLDF